MTELTMHSNKLSSVDFARSLVDEINSQADKALEQFGDVAWAKRHVACLRAVANYAAGLGPEDQRLFSLFLLNRALNEHEDAGKPFRDWNRFGFSAEQVKLLSRLGQGALGAPEPATTLAELVTTGIADLLTGKRGAEAGEREARNETAKVAEALDAEGVRHGETRALLAAATDNAESLSAALDEEREAVATLRSYVDQERVDKPEKRRRVKVEGETGIYISSLDEDPYTYEITWHDDKNGFHRRVVGEDLAAARRMREQLKGQPYAEPVAA